MNFKKDSTEILISFFLYWVFFGLIFSIPALKSGPITYFVFMSAGIKLFAVLIFRWRGAFGTFLAIFCRLILTNDAHYWMDWLVMAASVSFTLYLVVELGLRLFRTSRNLNNLTYYQIVILATAASIANGLVYAYTYNQMTLNQMGEGILHTGFLTVMGNFAGNAIFVCVAVFLLRHKSGIKAVLTPRKAKSKTTVGRQ